MEVRKPCSVSDLPCKVHGFVVYVNNVAENGVFIGLAGDRVDRAPVGTGYRAIG